MSSTVYVEFEEGTAGVGAKDWETFCSTYGIVYSPRTVGRNVFYDGEVEVRFGEENWEELPTLPAEPSWLDPDPDPRLDFSAARPPERAYRVVFSTYFRGPAMPRVAELARAFWVEYGGTLECSDELRDLFVGATERRKRS